MTPNGSIHPRGAALSMALALAFGGAHAMQQGDLEIKASLDKAVYSAYEDMVLRVEFRNHGAKPLEVPALRSGPVSYVLKDLGSGKERTAEQRPQAAPGIPHLAPAPFPLPAGKDLALDLEPASRLGAVAKGRYALQIKFNSGSVAFASDWLPFEMADSKIAFVTAAPSAQGGSGYLRLAWRDDGGGKPRILLRSIYIGPASGERSEETVSVGNVDATSAPVSAVSPAGSEGATAWLAWVAQGDLVLGSVQGRHTAEHASAIPESASDREVIGLAYFPKPGDEAHEHLAGLVAGRDSKGIALHGFEFPVRDAKPAWTSLGTVPGKLLDARLVAISGSRRLAFLLRSVSGQAHLEVRTWIEGKGFGAPMELASPAPETRSGSIPIFDAVALGESATWAMATADKGGRFELSSGIIDAEGHAHPRKPPTASGTFAALHGNLHVTLRLSPSGSPWIFQQDADGWWAQGQGFAKPRKLALPSGADFVRPYFRNGRPKVAYFVNGSGFATAAVDPDTGADNTRNDLR